MNPKIFTNSSTVHLYNKIIDPLLEGYKDILDIKVFSDGEISMLFPNSIRGNDIFILGDTSHNLEELIFSIDAAQRASVKSITVILPYYGYGRQDRKGNERVSIGGKVMAKILEDFKVDRLITIDLHASQIEGFFNIPVEHIKGHSIFLDVIKEKINQQIDRGYKLIICSPDEGGIKRARAFASKLSLPIVTISKKRDKANSIESMELMGDVKGYEVCMIDDMVDTCGTLCKAATYLKEKGAVKIFAVATHAVLSGNAIDNINCTKDLSEIFVSDTIFGNYASEKIKVVSCADVLSKAILGVINEKSLHDLTD